MKYLVLSAVFAISILNTFAQATFRKLPPSINHPSLNLYAPYLSTDGDAIVFVSDNAEDRVLTPFYSFRPAGSWNEPRTFPPFIHSRLNFLYGFSLSADGKTLFFSTMKGPGVGGFDLWMAEWNGSSWSAPKNPGMPLNSKAHDASLSITPDGTTAYFMRCATMDQNAASDCSILRITRRTNGTWTEPEELPGWINNGNAQAPRILADGQTLIFSSDKFSDNQGGMDLYMTRFENGNWSKPVALDFTNTSGDDLYVSVTATGRYLVRDAKGERRNEIIEHLMPAHLRPKAMMKLLGSVRAPDGSPAPDTYVSVVETKTGERFFSGRPDSDGSFFIYLREGGIYEMAVDPGKDHFTYFVQQFDLTTETIPQLQRVHAVIKPLEAGDELPMDQFSFAPYTAEVAYTGSPASVRRFTRMANANPDFSFEIQVLMEGYRQDSVQSDPDLTEVVYDSVRYTFDEIDSLGQLFQKDTIIVRETWHNDRTWKQAEAIAAWFVAQGIDSARLSIFANARPATIPGEKKLIVRAQVRRRSGN